MSDNTISSNPSVNPFANPGECTVAPQPPTAPAKEVAPSKPAPPPQPKDTIREKEEGLGDRFKSLIGDSIDLASDTASAAKQGVSGLVQDANDTVKNIARGVGQGVADVKEAVTDKAQEALDVGTKAVKDTANEVVHTVKTEVAEQAEAMERVGEVFTKGVKETLTEGIDTTTAVGKTLKKEIEKNLEVAKEVIEETPKEVVRSAAKGFVEMAEISERVSQKVATDAKDVYSNLATFDDELFAKYVDSEIEKSGLREDVKNMHTMAKAFIDKSIGAHIEEQTGLDLPDLLTKHGPSIDGVLHHLTKTVTAPFTPIVPPSPSDLLDFGLKVTESGLDAPNTYLEVKPTAVKIIDRQMTYASPGRFKTHLRTLEPGAENTDKFSVEGALVEGVGAKVGVEVEATQKMVSKPGEPPKWEITYKLAATGAVAAGAKAQTEGADADVSLKRDVAITIEFGEEGLDSATQLATLLSRSPVLSAIETGKGGPGALETIVEGLDHIKVKSLSTTGEVGASVSASVSGVFSAKAGLAQAQTIEHLTGDTSKVALSLKGEAEVDVGIPRNMVTAGLTSEQEVALAEKLLTAGLDEGPTQGVLLGLINDLPPESKQQLGSVVQAYSEHIGSPTHLNAKISCEAKAEVELLDPDVEHSQENMKKTAATLSFKTEFDLGGVNVTNNIELKVTNLYAVAAKLGMEALEFGKMIEEGSLTPKKLQARLKRAGASAEFIAKHVHLKSSATVQKFDKDTTGLFGLKTSRKRSHGPAAEFASWSISAKGASSKFDLSAAKKKFAGPARNTQPRNLEQEVQNRRTRARMR